MPATWAVRSADLTLVMMHVPSSARTGVVAYSSACGG